MTKLGKRGVMNQKANAILKKLFISKRRQKKFLADSEVL